MADRHLRNYIRNYCILMHFLFWGNTKINRRESRMHFKFQFKVPDFELNCDSKQDEELKIEFECKEVEMKKIHNLTHNK